jgi:uncharacterized protein (TIGR00645 family)
MSAPQSHEQRPLRPLPKLIFASRWLQMPLYLGLILAQAVYVFHFWVELVHLIEAAFGNQHALEMLVKSIGYTQVPKLNETVIMLVVLGLIDVVMISNLLIMVIVGGYETFVSRMDLDGHPDQPEWLSHWRPVPTWPGRSRPPTGPPSACSAVFVLATLWITKWAAAKTKSAADFYTAGGGITGFQNGLAIAGDYMSAASFLGISAAVMASGFDGLIYSIGFLVGWPVITFLMAERCATWASSPSPTWPPTASSRRRSAPSPPAARWWWWRST